MVIANAVPILVVAMLMLASVQGEPVQGLTSFHPASKPQFY